MSDQILEKLEELAGSSCSVHNEVWEQFTGQLNQMTLQQAVHTAELTELKETSRETRELNLRIQEQNFKLDKALDSLDTRKKENEAIFKKLRGHEDRFNTHDQRCPLEKQKIESSIVNIASDVKRAQITCKEERETLKEGIERSVDDKIEGTKNGQMLFRWLLFLFVLISISITAYNIDKTVELSDVMNKINISCEKLDQRQDFMNDIITHNVQLIEDLAAE